MDKALGNFSYLHFYRVYMSAKVLMATKQPYVMEKDDLLPGGNEKC